MGKFQSLFVIAVLSVLISLSPGVDTLADTSIGGIITWDTVKSEGYAGIFGRVLTGEWLFPPVHIRGFGQGRIVFGAEVNWIMPITFISSDFTQFFPFLLIGAEQPTKTIYAGISPVVFSEGFTWLYVGELYYSKFGYQRNFRGASIYIQGTYLLAIGQSEATPRDRFGVEVGLGFRF
ncbi:MAG: hypothetical protein ABEL51_14485 [Salinibacter sp.]